MTGASGRAKHIRPYRFPSCFFARFFVYGTAPESRGKANGFPAEFSFSFPECLASGLEAMRLLQTAAILLENTIFCGQKQENDTGKEYVTGYVIFAFFQDGGGAESLLPSRMKRERRGKREMLTMEALEAYGADIKTGLSRCMGMKDFYLRLVGMQLKDENFDKLTRALAEKNTREAFEAAHALKGAVGNLALTPLFNPVNEMTERLRNADGPVDVSDLLPAYEEALAKLRAMAE